MWERESRFTPFLPLFLLLFQIPLVEYSSWSKEDAILVPSIQLNYKVGELERQCTDGIADVEKQIRVFIDQDCKKLGSDEKVHKFDDLLWQFFDEQIQYLFMSMIHPDARIRTESETCERKLMAFANGLFSRQDLFKVLNVKSIQIQNYRLAAMMTSGFFESGLLKNQETADQISNLHQEMSVLEQDFEHRLKNDKTTLTFSTKELAGVPASVLSRLEKSKEGGYKVSLRAADVQDILTYADREETRKQLYIADQSKPGPENVKDLEDALLIRQKIASLLGYKNWAELQRRTEISTNPAQVRNFMNTLHTKLSEGLEQDLDMLESLKRKMDPNAGPLAPWDFAYFENKVLETRFKVDTDEFRSYFPAEQTTDRLLRLFGWLFGVTIEPAKELQVWDPTVRAMAFKDTKTGKTLGYVYLDLYQRKDKYNHAAAFQLRFGMNKNGARQLPLTAIVSNFTPPSNKALSALTLEEIVTLAHELGHIFHFILSAGSDSPSFSGIAVPTDFVEAPSQFFEYFIRRPEVLELLSGKVDQPSKKIPLKVAKAVIDHEHFFHPLHTARVVFRTMLDLEMHTRSGKVDTTQLARDLFQEYIGIPLPEGTLPQASFGHPMSGYDAKYSSYSLSRSFSADFFQPFERAGVLSADAQKKGTALRKDVFEAGFSDDPVTLCSRFLKRNPTTKAYFKEFNRVY